MEEELTPTITDLLDTGIFQGDLGTIARPRGSDWLKEEIQGWLKAKVQVVTPALTDIELEELNLEQESGFYTEMGIHLIGYPIPDGGGPASLQDWIGFMKNIAPQPTKGTRT